MGPSIGVPSATVLVAGLGVAVCTAGNLLLRFLRWHYLLRRFGVRLPAPASLGAFVGSFALLPVPLYLGQLVARVRLAREARAEQRGYLILAFMWERVLDAWALALLSVPFLPRGPAVTLGLAVSAFVVPGVRRAVIRVVCGVATYFARILLDEPVTFEPLVFTRCVRGSVFSICALLSTGAWAAVALSLVALLQATDIPIDPLAGMAVAVRAMLFGAFTLVPVGVGVAGFALIDELRSFLADPVTSVQVTFIFRAATAWLTIAIGAAALLALRRWRARTATHDHFDAIDVSYDAWLPLHYRRHLVHKKTTPMIAHLASQPAGLRGVDIGCGRGWYLRELEDSGTRMVGIDTAALQLVAAREYVGASVPLVRASGLSLPFREASFDFAYVINVLHHVSPQHQIQAIREIGNVVRENGMVFVHEMNVINPLFRFYLSYVYPIVKGIEEGDETYLDPQRMTSIPGLKLTALHYFTFVPDFVPRMFLPVLEPLERRLEKSRWARYGAHFLAVYTRVGTSSQQGSG